MIVLIVGPDTIAVRAEVDRHVGHYDPTCAITTRYDARETPLADIRNAVASVGFFGNHRVVIADHLLTKASRTSGDAQDEPTSKGPVIDFGQLFAAVPTENLLILADPTLGSIPATAKKAAPADALLVVCEPPRGRALVDLVQRTAQAAGGAMEVSAIHLLLDTLFPQTWKAKPTNPRYDRPPDTVFLRNEVEKLVMAADPDSVATSHVLALSPQSSMDRLFPFLEAAANGRLAPALVELEHLVEAGEELAKVSAQMAQQAELSALLDAAPGKDPVTIGRDLGLPNPNRMIGLAKSRRSGHRSPSIVMDALNADRGLKRGRLRRPEDALYAHLLAPAATNPNADGGT